MKRRAGVLFQWVSLGIAVGVACGIASAIFLFALEHATTFRRAHEWLVYCLPFAGLAIGLLYDRWGKPIKAGNNLVLDTIHENTPQLPLRMAPMVLIGTVLYPAQRILRRKHGGGILDLAIPLRDYRKSTIPPAPDSVAAPPTADGISVAQSAPVEPDAR